MLTLLTDRLGSLGIGGVFLLISAPVVGSLLGTLVRRLPEGRPIVAARSVCEACGITLTARDLVPFASWALARGRCRSCGMALGWFYPGIELAALVIAAIAVVVDGPDKAWLDCLLGWWLLTLGWIDLRTWLLPDVLTLSLLLLGLLAALALDPENLADRAAAAVIGYLAFRAIGWAYQHLRGREGLGEGDAKLFAAAGAWVGTAGLPQVLLLAAAAALLTLAALGLAGTRLRLQTAIPFGPFLALATWPVWLFGLAPS